MVLAMPGNPALWPLDEPAGSATVREASGRYPGTLYSTASLGNAGLPIAGTPMTAAACSSAAGYINTAMPAPSGAITIGGWIKHGSGEGKYFRLRNDYYGPSFMMNPFSDGRPDMYFAGNNYRVWSAVALGGNWHFWVITVPGSGQTDINSAACYFDGVALNVNTGESGGPQGVRSTIRLMYSAIGSAERLFVAGAVWSAADVLRLYKAGVNGA